MKISRVALQLVFAGTMPPALSGCITQPTVDLTKAPFKASTELSEAPLRASSELTNGTTNAANELVRPTNGFHVQHFSKVMVFRRWDVEGRA